jgi:hypothetical protein
VDRFGALLRDSTRVLATGYGVSDTQQHDSAGKHSGQLHQRGAQFRQVGRLPHPPHGLIQEIGELGAGALACFGRHLRRNRIHLLLHFRGNLRGKLRIEQAFQFFGQFREAAFQNLAHRGERGRSHFLTHSSSLGKKHRSLWSRLGNGQTRCKEQARCKGQARCKDANHCNDVDSFPSRDQRERCLFA